jgi:acid phosphatase class B
MQDKKPRGGNNNPSGRGGFGDNPQNRNKRGQRNKAAVAFARSLREYIVKRGEEKITLPDGKKIKRIESVVMALYKEAIFGNMTAIQFIADRVEGKVTDSLAVQHGGAVNVLVEYVNDWRANETHE